MGIGCCSECRERKLTKAQKMTIKFYEKLKSESEELEKKLWNIKKNG